MAFSEVSRAKIQLNEAKPRKSYANSCLQTVKACVRALTSEEREAIAEVESKLAAAEEEQMAATEFVRNKKIEMEAKLQFEFDQKAEQLKQYLSECETGELTHEKTKEKSHHRELWLPDRSTPVKSAQNIQSKAPQSWYLLTFFCNQL